MRAMAMRRLVIVAAMVGAMAVLLVYLRSREMRAGYRISELSREEQKLVEQVRSLNVQVTKLRQPDVIEKQVERLRIDLMREPEPQFKKRPTSR
jgi:UDP-N-acetylenolpyruvoylglucosamine reductase